MGYSVQTTWGHLVVWYLFLAGAGAGVYLLAICRKLWKGSTGFDKWAYYLSPLLVISGCLFLLLDLGQPLRAVLAVLRPQSSMISVGTIILTMFIMLSLGQACLSYRGKHFGKLFDYTGIILAIGTAAYTGLLLGVVKAIPFWNNPLLPILFLVSALSSGAGLVLLIGSQTETMPSDQQNMVFFDIFKLDVILVGLEAALLTILLLVTLSGGIAEAASSLILLKGFMAVPFWLFVIVIGLVVPLVVKFGAVSPGTHIALITGTCLTMGALALRYSIVMSGVWMPIN